MDTTRSYKKRDWVILSGEVDDTMTATLLAFLKESLAKNVTVYLNTYGGDVVQALHIYNMIKRSKKTVTVHAFGACMSAGTIIICAGDHRVGTPDCSFMIHYGEEVNTNSTEAKFNRMLERESRAIYKATLSASASTIGKWMKSDRYFKPNEALKYGLVEELKEIDHG